MSYPPPAGNRRRSSKTSLTEPLRNQTQDRHQSYSRNNNAETGNPRPPVGTQRGGSPTPNGDGRSAASGPPTPNNPPSNFIQEPPKPKAKFGATGSSNKTMYEEYKDEKTLLDKAREILTLQRFEDERKKTAWASWANSEFTKCKNARVQVERQWYINLAFYNGRQYISPVDVAGQGFRLTAPKAPPWRVRLVVNKIRTAVRAETSKLSSSRPIPTVQPATDEEQDFTAAKVGEAILNAKFTSADFERTYRDFIWWGSVTGCSYLKSYWSAHEPDDDLMKPQQQATGYDGQPMYGDDGEPIMKPQEPIYGKIVVERITPFHLFVPDLTTPDINKQPYVIHLTTRSPLWVERTFGFKPTADTRAANTIIESAFLINRNGEEHLDAVLVKEVWMKKNAHPDFPEGGMLTIINDRVVQHTDKWPWPFTEYPFYKYDGMPTGNYYGESTVTDLISLQKEYNRTRSQMVEIKNMMGKPKFLFQAGSVNVRQITSEPGQGIPYKPGFEAPKIMPGVEVPASMSQELERLNADFDDISSQHEISRGGSPSGITSGTAISFLQEQDDSKLHYQVSSIEYAMELLGKHYLRYVSHYWDEERLVKIVGKDAEFEAKLWKGSDLRGNTDVRIRTGSALPTSKAAKSAMITEFMQYGWLDPQVGLELLEMGGLDKAIDQMLIDKRQAYRENLKMSELDPHEVGAFLQPPRDPYNNNQHFTHPETGESGYDPDYQAMWQPRPPIPVNSWDNHQAHIQYHNNYRKTQEFELLPEEIKQAFELHVQMHQLALSPAPMSGQLGMVSNDPEAAAMHQQGQDEQAAAEGQAADAGLQNNLANAATMSQINANEANTALAHSRIENDAAGR